MSFFDKFPYTNFHELNLDWIISQIKTVHDSMIKAVESAKNAKQSEDNAKTSETNAKTSETNASKSASSASTSASNASTSARSAKISEENASRSAGSASASADSASTSAGNASTSASNAKTSETNASASAEQAKTSETNAKSSADRAFNSAGSAKDSENKAQASASKAQSVASEVSSTVYYQSNSFTPTDSTAMIKNLKIEARNGLLILTGRCQTKGRDSSGNNTKKATSAVMMFSDTIYLKNMKDVNDRTPREWLDLMIPNIAWNYLIGIGVVASEHYTTLRIVTTDGTVRTVNAQATGGIMYSYNANNPILTSCFTVNFEDRASESLTLATSNFYVPFSMTIPLVFK